MTEVAGMGIEAVRSLQPHPSRSSDRDAGSPGGFTLPEVAAILSALGHSPMGTEQIRDRAVSLGLLRWPLAGETPLFTPQTLSRLLLAGYRLPAVAEPMSLSDLCGHLREGRLVFVRLPILPDSPSLFRLICFDQDGSVEPALLLHRPGAGREEPQLVSLVGFTEVWREGGNLAIAASAGWDELPAAGSIFFAGSRCRDGSYHWHTAECETDADGQILRF